MTVLVWIHGIVFCLIILREYQLWAIAKYFLTHDFMCFYLKGITFVITLSVTLHLTTGKTGTSQTADWLAMTFFNSIIWIVHLLICMPGWGRVVAYSAQQTANGAEHTAGLTVQRKSTRSFGQWAAVVLHAASADGCIDWNMWWVCCVS